MAIEIFSGIMTIGFTRLALGQYMLTCPKKPRTVFSFLCLSKSMSSSSISGVSERAAELVKNYKKLANDVENQASRKNISKSVHLLAVSKFKPSSDIKALYDYGVLDFGENYVQELISKSEELPKDIKWHFIGGLQTNKCNELAKKVENLYSIESVDSIKKCEKLQNARKSVDGTPIKIFLQINTSDEGQKSGFDLHSLSNLYNTIEYLLSSESTKLEFEGLMTIGSFSESVANEKNKDFERLVALKQVLDKKYNTDLKLSMGMSNDFRQAIEQGSTNIRVGSLIFGARPIKS